MPIPLVAAAPVAAALVTVAAVRALRRAAHPAMRDQRTEDALDRTPEGLAVRKEDEAQSGSLRYRRVLRWKDGRAWELDLTALGRIRLKRL